MRVFPTDRRIRAGYGTALLLLLISYILTLVTNAELLNQAKMVDQTDKVINYLETAVSSLKGAESSVKSYLLLKDDQFLESYQDARTKTAIMLGLLHGEMFRLLSDTSSLDTIQSLIEQKLHSMQWMVDYYSSRSFHLDDSLRQASLKDNLLMRSISSKTSKTQNDLEKILEHKTSAMVVQHKALNAIVLVSVLLAFLLALYGFLTYSRENKARRRADQTVFDYQEKLKKQIQDLNAANTELVQTRSIEKLAATGRIARTIAHEVRNPLTNINLSVDQLKCEPGFSDETSGLLLNMIIRNSNRINQLITELLNSTKLTELSFTNISINKIMDETLDLAMDRLRLKNIELRKFYSPDICDVSVDAEKIKIAILNLIVNAVEAMPDKGGILELRTEGSETGCVITIQDNGHGIDKESLSKLFEPYFTTKQKGTGLGLTNAQNIIINHNGSIRVESIQEKGTRFIIHLQFAKK